MKLKNKILFLILSFTTFLVIISSFLISTYVMKGYIELEENHFNKDVERIEFGIQSAIDHIIPQSQDWSTWDDSYYFILGQMPNYINANISPDTFEILKINHFILSDLNGNTVFSKSYDLLAEQYIDTPIELIESAFETPYESGLMLIENKPVIVTTQPILKTDGEGPIVGYLSFAADIDASHIDAIVSNTRFNIEKENFSLPYNEKELIHTTKITDDFSKADFYIPYINTEKALFLSLTNNNEIVALGRATIYKTLTTLLLSFFILGLLLYLSMKKFASQIQKLSNSVSNIAHGEDLSKRIDVSGSYELDLLSDEVNFMLERIENLNQSLFEYATTDILTGIFNRRIGIQKLKEAMALSDENKKTFTIAYIDINNLKHLNDNHGHAVGDKLIIDTVRFIQRHIHPEDSLCRLGGDEFLLIMPLTSLVDAKALFNSTEDILDELNCTPNKLYEINFSYGLAEYNYKLGYNLDQFLEYADTEMYNHKIRTKHSTD